MRVTLGEFEEIVLLLVAADNGNAYGYSITKRIESKLERPVTMSSVHTVLYRLEEKGLVSSTTGGTNQNRGGRSKRLFSITALGKKALLQSKGTRERLWQMVPSSVIQTT